MNVACILAAGAGNRFGSAIPKQYHELYGRPVINYVINAVRKSIADDIVVVANNTFSNKIKEEYDVYCIEGGETRNQSIKNAIEYIEKNIQCNKLMLIDATCPMVTSDLIDLLYSFIDEYDAAFCVSKINTSLGRYDRKVVNRDDYFILQSPDTYRFDTIKRCISTDPSISTTLHMLPDNTKIKYYEGFRDYVKIIYPRDIAIAEALLRERESKMNLSLLSNSYINKLLIKMRKTDRNGSRIWERGLDKLVKYVFSKWEIYDYSVNPNSYTAIVIEGNSIKYGDVFLKI